MSFSTLPPDSGTLVSKWNTKLALIWKEDFGPLGKSPVLLFSSGKMPLTTTVAKFLDTSVCGGSWFLDSSLSPFLVKLIQILESIFLDNPHKAAVLSVGCATFSSTLFPSTQLSVNLLGYSTLWTASFFGNFTFYSLNLPCHTIISDHLKCHKTYWLLTSTHCQEYCNIISCFMLFLYVGCTTWLWRGGWKFIQISISSKAVLFKYSFLTNNNS